MVHLYPVALTVFFILLQIVIFKEIIDEIIEIV